MSRRRYWGPPADKNSGEDWFTLDMSNINIFSFTSSILMLTRFLQDRRATLVIGRCATRFVNGVLHELRRRLRILRLIAMEQCLRGSDSAQDDRVLRFEVGNSQFRRVHRTRWHQTTTVQTGVAVMGVRVTGGRTHLLGTIGGRFAI